MTLKKVLLVNGISSGATGMLLALFPKFFSKIFELGITTPFIGTGIFLILFSVFVLVSAFGKPISLNGVKTIIIMDASWVIASLVCIGIFYNSISNWGSFIIFGVALWVGLMAYLQQKFIKSTVV